MVTLETLAATRMLQPPRPELVSDPPRIDASTPEERAVPSWDKVIAAQKS